MRHDRQVELLRRLKGVDPSAPWPLAPETYRNPAANYTDPHRFARERQILFRQHPQLIGLSCEVAGPAPPSLPTSAASPSPSSARMTEP